MLESLKLPRSGRSIRLLREGRGLTLENLADRLGWNKGRLSKYENGRLSVTLTVLEQIAKALDERTEVVVLYCLKHCYPELSLAGSKTGHLLQKLVDSLGD